MLVKMILNVTRTSPTIIRIIERERNLDDWFSIFLSLRIKHIYFLDNGSCLEKVTMLYSCTGSNRVRLHTIKEILTNRKSHQPQQ